MTADQILIDLIDAGKTYTTGTVEFEALKDINLTVGTGSYLAIVGPSGSGKSTLMNIIGCLDRLTTGTYRLNGRETASLSDDELAVIRNQEVGFVFQNFNLLPKQNILENVELPLLYQGVSRAERRDRALEALEGVGLADWREHRPTEISGGQKQRVAIARALVTQPRLLLADEPTGNLDTRVSDEVMKLFDKIHSQETSIVLITHDAQVAAHADRVITIRDGRIIADGSAGDILKRKLENGPLPEGAREPGQGGAP